MKDTPWLIIDTETSGIRSPIYTCEWSKALGMVNRFIKVTWAMTAGGEAREKIQDNPELYTYFPRFSGEVGFEVLLPNSTRTGVGCTYRRNVRQDDFMRILISGELPPTTPLTPTSIEAHIAFGASVYAT